MLRNGEENMNTNCILCGVGGQGTVLAAKVLADVAITKGEEVKTTETIGMAQRGGSVVSHVRMGKQIHSPLIQEQGADLIISFEPSEAVRNLKFLKKGGTIITAVKAVKPVTATLAGSSYDGSEMLSYTRQNDIRLISADTDKICEICGSTRVVNVALLGAVAKTGILGITIEEIKQALFKRLPEKTHALNEKALVLGQELADSLS